MRGTLVVLALVLGVFGCDDSAAPAAPGGGTGGSTLPPIGGTGGAAGGGGAGGAAGDSGGGGGSTGQGGRGGDAGAGGNDGGGGFGGAAALGDCSSQGDFSALAALIADGGGARMEAASLALSQDCLNDVQNEVDFTACVASGLQEAVLPESLSNECAQCYGDLAWCSRPGACNLPCSNNACDEIQCRMCPGYPACENILATCTGRTPDECGGT
jgi:hypothetical protein